MTNLKRALSLVLVLALALSMVVMGTSAAKFTDVKADYAFSTEVQFLSDLGILTGYSDGTYKAEGTVTRAEASAVIYRMLSGKTSAANYAGATKFADVTAAHWASGYVNFCVELGVVAGYPDGNFYPDKTLTYAEYVTMLVRALGLDKGKDPAYPFGYIALASVESVNANVDLQASEACNRGAVAKLTYNSILDATYARIANSIYVTEKPTIAKDILKLKSVDGVLTSTGDYSFIDSSDAGDKNFTLSQFDKDDEDYYPVLIGEFKVATTDLGKKATVWYKEDSTETGTVWDYDNKSTKTGIKVLAVVTDTAKEFANIHISFRGFYTGKANELTYVVNDIDKTLKLDEACQFVENNEFLFASKEGADKTPAFYPSAYSTYTQMSRAWLPMSYRFIDNDNDGDYDFAIRTVFGFKQVTNLTDSKITLDGLSAIDRKDDAGNAYAWSAALKDLAVDDYVMYTCDGAINTTSLPLYNAGQPYIEPDFEADLYEDTNNAMFVKIAKQTGTLDSIAYGDKAIIGGKAYSLMRFGEVDDLGLNDPTSEITADIGDTFEYYPLASFYMIAKADGLTTSSGKYLIITDLEKIGTIGDNFTIEAIDENGDENTYTVDGSSDGLLSAAGAKSPLDETTVDIGGFYAYTLNSAGKINKLQNFTAAGTDTIEDSDDSYVESSKLLKTDDNSYVLQDSTLVYVLDGNGNYKVYVGAYPKITGTTTVLGVEASKSSTTATEKLKALYIETDDTTVSGSSNNEDLVGYLKGVSTYNNTTDKNYSYKYEIWYDGAVKVYYSNTVTDSSDLTDLVDDDGNLSYTVKQGGVVVFDLDSDGTISNMRLAKTEASQDLAAEDFHGSYVVTKVDSSNKLITVQEVENVTADTVSAGATVGAGAAGTANTITAGKISLGAKKTYAYNSDTNVYSFDITSTDLLYAEPSSIGSIIKSDSVAAGDEIYLVSFKCDDDDEIITDLFYNDSAITITAPSAAEADAAALAAAKAAAATAQTAYVAAYVANGGTSANAVLEVVYTDVTAAVTAEVTATIVAKTTALKDATTALKALTAAKAAATAAKAAYLAAGGENTDTVYTDVTTAVTGGVTATIVAKTTLLTTATTKLTAAIAAVNNAASVSAMKAALTNADLGLDLTAYTGLTATQQGVVAQLMLDEVFDDEITSRADIQTAFDAAILLA